MFVLGESESSKVSSGSRSTKEVPSAWRRGVFSQAQGKWARKPLRRGGVLEEEREQTIGHRGREAQEDERKQAVGRTQKQGSPGSYNVVSRPNPSLAMYQMGVGPLRWRLAPGAWRRGVFRHRGGGLRNL